MQKTFYLAATLSTAIIALLPLAPKVALGQGCSIQTSNDWSIDMSSLCKGFKVPVYIVSKLPTYNHRNQWGLGLDLPSYCKEKYGLSANVTLRENNALGWKCSVGTQTQEIAFEEACSMQYGPSARPGMGDFDDIGSWHCRLTKNMHHQSSGS